MTFRPFFTRDLKRVDSVSILVSIMPFSRGLSVGPADGVSSVSTW